MALQTANSGFSSVEAFQNIRLLAQSAKNTANNDLAALAGTVNTFWVFSFLDRANGFIATMNSWKGTAGLDSFATSQGYIGSLVADVGVSVTAAQACITWIVANFPKDSTLTFILDMTLNSDGTRTPRQFTSVQTVGLQTALQTFIASIS